MTRFSARKLLPWTALGAFAVLFFLYFQKSCYEVPILMYHHVDDAPSPSSVYVSPENFERQMEFLKLHRYRVMELAEIVRRLKAGERLPKKAVAITFDDGYADNLVHAFPVLKKMGFPATVFMITANIGRDGWLSEEDLRIMDGSAVTIGSHTVNHAFLPELPAEEARTELADSKAALEAILGHPVPLFSYPAGGTTPALQKMAERTGYEGAATTNYGTERHDPYALHRIKVGDANLFNFWYKASGYAWLGKKRVEARPAAGVQGVMRDE